MSDEFHDVLIDDGLIIYETEGGPEFHTDVVVTENGELYRNSARDEALGRFNVGNRKVLYAELQTMLKFFRARKGQAIGFLLKDWGDYICLSSEGRLGVEAIGTGMPTYDCWRRYADAGGSDDKRLWKLVTGTFTGYRNAGPLTVGAGAGQISIDLLQGRVTFVADASSAASSITVGATTQVVLAANPGTLITGEKLHLSGFSGADAALVNALAHTINSVTGSGPFTFTLATDTAGKAITLGSGLGAKYPQASDALTFASQFYLPVCFGSDAIRYRFLGKDGNDSMFELAALPVVELLTP